MQKVRITDKIELACQFLNKPLLSTQKPLLIFLHEGLGSIAQWKSFPRQLAESLNLPALIYERYGYGHSTPFFDTRQIDYLHKEAEIYLPELLNKLELRHKQLILFGHSDGASIALIHAAKFPENITAVISVAAHVFVEEISLQGIKQAKQFYLSNPVLKEKLSKYHFNHTDSTFFAWTDTWLKPEFKQWNIEHLLPDIKAPVLAVQGADDEYGTKKQIESIVKHCPNPQSKQVLIPNCKHSPHVQASDILLTEACNFLLPLLENNRYELLPTT